MKISGWMRVVGLTGIVAAFLAVPQLAYSQSAVIRGESGPGVYQNLPTTPSASQSATPFPQVAGPLVVEGVTTVWNGSTHAPIFGSGSTIDGVAANNTSLQAQALHYSFNGTSWDRIRVAVTFKPLAAVAVGSEATIWTPTSGKRFRLMGFCLSQGTAAGNVTLKDNTAGSTIFVIPKNTADAAVCLQLGNGILSAAANNVLTATGVATETLSGTIWGTEE